MIATEKSAEQCHLALGKAESLLLFERLGRVIDDEKGRPLRSIINDDAEIWALNHLYLRLQRTLSEPFTADYTKIIEAARTAVCKSYGGQWPE